MPPITTIASSSPEKAHRDRLGRDEVVEEAEQRAAQARHHRREHERAEPVAVDVVALEGGALLVLADRDEHVPEGRAQHAQQRVQHAEAR